MMWGELQLSGFNNQVSCIDREIAELQARKHALLNGYCFTGYYEIKSYLDPYGLSDGEEWKDERDSNETEHSHK